jgi:hypothetical protein
LLWSWLVWRGVTHVWNRCFWIRVRWAKVKEFWLRYVPNLGSLVSRPIWFFNLGLQISVLKTAISNLCDPHRSQLFGGSCSAGRWGTGEQRTGAWWDAPGSLFQAAATTTALATKYGADITVVGKFLCLGEAGFLHLHMWAGRFLGGLIHFWVTSSYSLIGCHLYSWGGCCFLSSDWWRQVREHRGSWSAHEEYSVAHVWRWDAWLDLELSCCLHCLHSNNLLAGQISHKLVQNLKLKTKLLNILCYFVNEQVCIKMV